MKEPSKAIVCGLCHVAVSSPTNPKADDEITCPRCGAGDRYEDVSKAMFQHIEYRLKRAAGKSVSQTMREMGLAPANAAADDTQEPFFKWRIKD